MTSSSAARADRDLLDEQLAYYRERAPEYDRWWQRSHQYALPSEAKDTWDREVRALEAWVASLDLTGTGLELACGTGVWTSALVATARHLTAVDGAPETIAINRAKPGHDSIEFVTADVFEWRPVKRYDFVFFSFWYSHVPPSRWQQFWSLVEEALQPTGRAVFIDNAFRPDAWPFRPPDGYEQARTDLSSGNAYRVVKRYFEPAQLDAELAGLGWDSDSRSTGRFFVYGTATPSGAGA